MDGWLIGIAAVLAVAATSRIWFRWFSRRPLSTVDRFAEVVDTSVDAIGNVTTAPTSPATGPLPRSSPRTTFPQQRSAAQAADNAPGRDTSTWQQQR